MADTSPRPQRLPLQDDGVTRLIYDFHIEIEVKSAPADEKRLQQLIDERIERLAATLRNHAR